MNATQHYALISAGAEPCASEDNLHSILITPTCEEDSVLFIL